MNGVAEWALPILSLTGQQPLSLNDRRHWRTRHRITQQIKTDVAWQTRLLMPRGTLRRVCVHLLWEPKTARARDGDNLAPTIKAAVDGLVHAGVIADDDTTQVMHLPIAISEPTGAPSRFHLIVATDPRED